MHIQAIKIPQVQPHGSLYEILDTSLDSLQNGDIFCITSKIISLCQGRFISKQTLSKTDLIYQEADSVLSTLENPYELYLTIKDDILIPSAGIDESNAGDCYILLPKNAQKTAIEIWTYLKKRNDICHLGVIITDSHTTIMRRGVTGIALGWCGFKPLHSYINKKDLHGKPLRVTQINIIDALATAAVFMMGEGNEQTPLAIIQNAPKIDFQDHPPTPLEEQSVKISMEEDLYGPLLKSGHWLSQTD